MLRLVCRPSGEALESRELMAIFAVSNTADSGFGSLRWAINSADRNPGPDFINFDIPGTGNHQITVVHGGLPAINGQVVINGFTQPGSAPNTSTNPFVNNANVTVRIVANGGSQGVLTVA
jgi:hypothetical protein